MRDTLEFAGMIVSSGAEATSVKRVRQSATQSMTFCWVGILTRHGEVLTGRDVANTREVDVHEGRGIKSRNELRDEFGIGKMGFYSGDAQASVVGRLGINEGAQERKSDCGSEKKHTVL